MNGETDGDELDSFEAELEGLLLQDQELAPISLDVTLRAELPDSVSDRLQLEETLGIGGSGAVFRAIDRETGEACALKLLRVEGSSPAQRSRIRREYRAGCRLDHPHIVRSGEFFEGEKVWAFTMELLDGSLRRRISEGPMPWRTAVNIAQEVLAALDHVHSENVVHRDLKPENILLGPERDDGPGSAKLADFGIARFGELGSYSSLLGISGTPPYMPPEAFDERRFDPRGDLYALGLVLLEMINGAHPLDSRSADDWPRRHREFVPKRPDDIPDALWDVVQGLLERQPEIRTKTAREAFDTLAALTPPRDELPELRAGAYVASTSLIGRDAELATVQQWLDRRMDAEGPPVLWLSGEAGVGKSRLLQQISALDDERTVLVGRGQRHVRRPFASLTAALSYLSYTPPSAPSMTRFPTASTVPLTEERLASQQTDDRAGDAPQELQVAHRAFVRNMVDAMLSAAAKGPLLLIVEDLHWADEGSVELLEGFARALAGQALPAAVLVTSRPVEDGTQTEEMLSRLQSDDLSTAVELGPLDLEATRALVGALLMDERRGAELAELIHQGGSTTPLLVVQTLHVLLGRGALPNTDDLSLAQLPQTVQKAVGERVAHLSGLAKALLAMAAVLGSEFTVGELEACLESEEFEMRDYLDEAEQGGFIETNAATSEIYRFVHEEFRDALSNGLGDEVVELHQRAADGLRAVYEDRETIAARVADHLGASEDWAGAWEWGLLAGDVALRHYSFRASAASLDTAFAAAEQAEITPSAEDWQLRGDALMFSGRNRDAAFAYERALQMLDPDDRNREVVILGRLAELEYRASRLTHALEPLIALVPRLGGEVAATDDEVELASRSLLAELADSSLVQPVPEEDAQRLEVLCHTYRNLAEVAYYFRAARRDYYAVQATRLALRLGTTNAAAQGFGLFAFRAAQQGQFDLVDVVAERAIAAADACNDPVSEMFAKSMAASAQVMAGEPSKGIAGSTEAWKIAQEVAEPLRLMTVASIQALTLGLIGRVDEAFEVAERMQEAGVRYGYRRVWELGYLSGAAAGLCGAQFDRVLQLTTMAEELDARGSRMVALQMRSYRRVAQAFLGAAPKTDPIDLAEQWAVEGFDSMLCNPDANALIVGALSPRRLGDHEIERFEECIERGWDVSHRNRAKTGLFLAAAGLFRRSVGRDDDGMLAAGIEHVEAQGLLGDLTLIEAAKARVTNR